MNGTDGKGGGGAHSGGVSGGGAYGYGPYFGGGGAGGTSPMTVGQLIELLQSFPRELRTNIRGVTVHGLAPDQPTLELR